MVCLECLDSPDLREILVFPVQVEFLEIAETLVLLVFPETLAFLRLPSW